MIRNLPIVISIILIIILVLAGCNNSEMDLHEPTQPNILLIMSDDQGWGDAGYQGHPHLKTPHLDSMAASGLVFHRFYAAAPVCSPTRGSVLTGRHPYRYGVYYANSGHLPEEEKTLPEILNENGYLTGHFGKWHLGTMSKIVIESNRGGFSRTIPHYAPPWEHGYQEVFATESKVPTWDPMINPDTTVAGANHSQKPGDSFGTYYWTGPGEIATENLTGDDSRVIMDRVIPFVRKAVGQKKPFFSTIWFHTPHSPVIAGEKDQIPYQHLSNDQQHYYGCITAMDQQIGRLRQALQEMEVEENTMIWFCSDNGPAAEGGGPGWQPGGRQQGITGGLKGRKGSLYEGGIRVPGILVWPDRIKKPRSTDFPAVTSDYLPTILDILNIQVSVESDWDGISLKGIIEGNQNQERSSAIGFQSRFSGKNYQVWLEHEYKLIHQLQDSEWELYNIQEDPAETQNLVAEQPEIVTRMQSELRQWIEAVEKDFD